MTRKQKILSHNFQGLQLLHGTLSLSTMSTSWSKMVAHIQQSCPCSSQHRREETEKGLFVPVRDTSWNLCTALLLISHWPHGHAQKNTQEKLGHVLIEGSHVPSYQKKKKKWDFIIKEEEKKGCWRTISRVIECMRNQFSSVTQACPTLCDPMDCSTPGFPVHLQLLEPTQTHVRWVGDAIQPSHPLSSPSPPVLSFPALGSFPTSRFFTSGGQNIGVSASASVLPMNIQDWFPLGWTDWIPLQSKGLSGIFSNTTVQKRQFFGTQLSL